MTMAKTEAFELQRKLEAALKEVRLLVWILVRTRLLRLEGTMGVQGMLRR